MACGPGAVTQVGPLVVAVEEPSVKVSLQGLDAVVEGLAHCATEDSEMTEWLTAYFNEAKR